MFKGKDHAHAVWAVFLVGAALALVLSGTGSYGFIVGGILALIAILQMAMWIDS